MPPACTTVFQITNWDLHVLHLGNEHFRPHDVLPPIRQASVDLKPPPAEAAEPLRPDEPTKASSQQDQGRQLGQDDPGVSCRRRSCRGRLWRRSTSIPL